MKCKTTALASLIDDAPRSGDVAICPFINEPLPPSHELLTSRDVARLIRRPKWLFLGLTLIGKFPRRQRFHGRSIGWLKSDIQAWISTSIPIRGNDRVGCKCMRSCRRTATTPKESRRAPHQTCLPLYCEPACRRINPLQIRGSLHHWSGGVSETHTSKRSATASVENRR